MLIGVLLTARLLLAAVFVVAGVAKLIDKSAAREAIVEFGLPSPLAAPVAKLLPLTELALAMALLVSGTVWWASLATLGLLGLFSVAISVNLIRGRKPACHCFGQLSTGPMSWRSLIRNGVLAVAAGLIVWQGPDSFGLDGFAWLGVLNLTGILIVGITSISLALLVGITWLLMELWRLIGRLLVRVDELEARLSPSVRADLRSSAALPESASGLAIGWPAPPLRLDDIYGETQTLDAIRATLKPTLLVFADPNCEPCATLMPELGRWQREYTPKVSVTVISRGTLAANRSKAIDYGLTNVLVQQNDEVVRAYGAYATPSAVLIRANGTIGSPVTIGPDAIRDLVRRTVSSDLERLPVLAVTRIDDTVPNGYDHQHAPPRGPGIGEQSPPLRLPDLSGRAIDLADFSGHPTLVLFWNPGCGFCQEMLDDLKAWEQSPPVGGPVMLVVSSGSVEANRVMHLRSPVVLDPSFSVGYAFGVNGTPSAVLLDTEGRIAAPVAVGAIAVLDLARTGSPHAGVGIRGQA